MRLYFGIALASISLIIVESVPDATTRAQDVRCDVECKSGERKFAKSCFDLKCKVKTLDHCRTMYMKHRRGFICGRNIDTQCAGCGPEGLGPQWYPNQCTICQMMLRDQNLPIKPEHPLQQINNTICASFVRQGKRGCGPNVL